MQEWARRNDHSASILSDCEEVVVDAAAASVVYGNLPLGFYVS